MRSELTTSPIGLSATFDSGSQYRATRHKRQAQKARANLLLLLAADTRTRYRAVDHIVTKLASNLGFARHDLIIVRLALSGRTITVIVAPRRIWHRADIHRQLLLLKHLARRISSRVILVPDEQLKKQPRLDNAAAVVAAADTNITISQRMRVETFVLSEGGSATLGACAQVLPDHTDPFGALMALVHAGRFYLNLNLPITPDSRLTSCAVVAGGAP